MSGLHLVALGSSFAAGPGIQPQVEPLAAGRSSRNFVNLLSLKLPNSRVTDLAVSGATLLNVLSEPQVKGDTIFPPQLDGLPADADVVMVLAGGNDLGYIGDMMNDALGVVEKVVPWWVGGGAEKTRAIQDELAQRMEAVVDRIHITNPEARIILIEYLTLLGKDVKPNIDISLNEQQMKHHQNVAEMLRNVYRATAESRADKCELLEVGKLSWEHGLGSKEPWVAGCSWKEIKDEVAPLHPLVEGMQAVADMLFEKLRN